MGEISPKSNGMHDSSHPKLPTPLIHDLHGYTTISDDDNPNLHRLPKFQFLAYDGDTTKLWISQAEDYFEMYGVPPRLWVKVAGMHFNGAAKHWIQSLDRPRHLIPWSEFCQLLLDRFARDQHETLLCQMFQIFQTTSVIDYVERFSSTIDQLKAYTKTPDMHTYTTRFVDGLRADIRVVVVMQHPKTLDTVYSLALLQEEVAEPSMKSEYPKFPHTSGFKTNSKNALAFPRPPQAQAVKTADQALTPTKAASTVTDKLSELHQYRHAQGLCDRCAKKWHRGHKSPTTVQLHAMQELWDLFAVEDEPELSEEAPEQILALSPDARTGSRGPRSIQF